MKVNLPVLDTKYPISLLFWHIYVQIINVKSYLEINC